MKRFIRKLLATIIFLGLANSACTPQTFECDDDNAESTELIEELLSPTENSDDTPGGAAVELPQVICDTLAELSVPMDSLGSCEQLLLVTTDGNTAEITKYEVNSSGKWECLDQVVDGYIGSCGATQTKTEGDKKTPMGLFELGIAFGNEEKPDTKLSYRQIDRDSYWVDDSKSENYNTWVEGTDGRDWNSAEHLSDYRTAYALAVVIEYNTDPVIPNAGSAIFLHCGSLPTAGCVSVSHNNMVEILKWLNPSKHPMILIH